MPATISMGTLVAGKATLLQRHGSWAVSRPGRFKKLSMNHPLVARISVSIIRATSCGSLAHFGRATNAWSLSPTPYPARGIWNRPGFIRFFTFLILSTTLLLAGCAPPMFRAGIPTQWYPSPNFGERRPNYVVIHHTTNNSVEQSLSTLTNPERGVSSHYLIGRDGTIIQLVDERARAWHAGESQWGVNSDLNSSSIGIELDNTGYEPFPEKQISALLALLNDIRLRYNIPVENFLGHADIAPRRKSDPSRYFPWKQLAQYGFGRWCGSPLPDLPALFDSTLALRALGYDVSDLAAAIRAFKLHYAPDDTLPTLTDHDKMMLNCLLLKQSPRDNL